MESRCIGIRAAGLGGRRGKGSTSGFCSGFSTPDGDQRVVVLDSACKMAPSGVNMRNSNRWFGVAGREWYVVSQLSCILRKSKVIMFKSHMHSRPLSAGGKMVLIGMRPLIVKVSGRKHASCM